MARGLGVRDTSTQLEEMYGVKVSATPISEVTDAVNEEVKAWQNRPQQTCEFVATAGNGAAVIGGDVGSRSAIAGGPL